MGAKAALEAPRAVGARRSRRPLSLRDTARAMSQENVETVRASIDGYNRGDWDALIKDGAASFEFDFSRSVRPGRGVYSLDQMRGFFHESLSRGSPFASR